MIDSQTVKKKVMLAGRIPADLKKRFAVAIARRGWKVQPALEKIVEEWVVKEEGGDQEGDNFNPPRVGGRERGAPSRSTRKTGDR